MSNSPPGEHPASPLLDFGIKDALPSSNLWDDPCGLLDALLNHDCKTFAYLVFNSKYNTAAEHPIKHIDSRGAADILARVSAEDSGDSELQKWFVPNFLDSIWSQDLEGKLNSPPAFLEIAEGGFFAKVFKPKGANREPACPPDPDSDLFPQTTLEVASSLYREYF